MVGLVARSHHKSIRWHYETCDHKSRSSDMGTPMHLNKLSDGLHWGWVSLRLDYQPLFQEIEPTFHRPLPNCVQLILCPTDFGQFILTLRLGMARFFSAGNKVLWFSWKKRGKMLPIFRISLPGPWVLAKMLISEDLGVIYSTTNYNNLPTLKLNSPQRKLLKQY